MGKIRKLEAAARVCLLFIHSLHYYLVEHSPSSWIQSINDLVDPFIFQRLSFSYAGYSPTSSLHWKWRERFGYPSMSFLFPEMQKMPRSCLANPCFKAAGTDGTVRRSPERPPGGNQGASADQQAPQCQLCKVCEKADSWEMFSKHDPPAHLLLSTTF